MKKLFFVAALLVAAGEKSLAQGVRLDDSIITETNFETNVLSVAKNVTVITAEEIQEKGAKTVADALKGVPNLKTSTLSGSDSKFDLRGQGEAAFSNTIVLLDGIPLNSIDLSGYKTSQIPIENIERIEIIPSGGSVLYGDGAIGGIINIISKAPLDIENYGSVGLEYGSNNFLKSNLNFGTKLTDKTLLDLNYSSKNFDTFRDDSKDNSDSI
ncbi:MAG: TonB-dependent receptor plug domain-containing protein, partial [Fusobacteriaceae bacterium]